MRSRASWTVFLLITFCFSAIGQKIKYKELIVLLNARQFDDAEPYLKKYLKTNDDNPNAYFYMGIIYEEKSKKIDALRQTENRVMFQDSAVYFYEIAKKGITEKELSRNEEYYPMFVRRDVRTGKFETKLSDATLFFEDHLKLTEKSKLILLLKSQFVSAENHYKHAQQIFLEIQKAYEGPKEFYLRSDEALLSKLSRLAQVYDSCHISFNDYKATSQTFGKTGYNQDFDPVEISNFKKDGTAPVDFYLDDLRIWDYKRWALSSEDKIIKEINPMRDQLVAVDTEINQVLQKLKKDSVSVREEIAKLRGKIRFAELRKIDQQAMPLRVFDMKLSELDYGCQIIEDRSVRDSVSIAVHIQALRKELSLAKKVDSLSSLFPEDKLEEEFENYRHFVSTAYGTPAVLKSQIKGTKEYGARSVSNKEEALRKKTESLRWIVDGQDSIPLFLDVKPASRFKPILLTEMYTAGLQYADSIASGYFYSVAPSRKTEVKAVYSVDASTFVKRNLPFTKALIAQDEKGLVYFVMFYSETKIKDKYPASLAKIYKAEGLSWSINYTFDQLPSEMSFSSETFVLSVKTRSSIGEVFGLNFDKNGKLIK